MKRGGEGKKMSCMVIDVVDVVDVDDSTGVHVLVDLLI